MSKSGNKTVFKGHYTNASSKTKNTYGNSRGGIRINN